MRLAVLSLALLVVGSFVVRAQQAPQFTHYAYNQLYLNPANSGLTHDIGEFKSWEDIPTTKFFGLFRWQWAGYEGTFDDGGSPVTGIFSINAPLQDYNIGVGFFVMSEEIGPIRNTDIQLSAAYHLELDSDGSKIVSFGARGGVLGLTVDGNELRPVESGDPLIPTGSQTWWKPDASAGIQYTSPTLFGGVSYNHLLDSEYDVESADLGGDGSFDGRDPHLNVMLGYNLNIGRSLVFTPSVLGKSDLNEWSIEGTGIFTYNRMLNLGLGYRQDEGPLLIAGVNLLRNQDDNYSVLSVSYAFDYVIQGQEAKSPTSHELGLTYRIPKVQFLSPQPQRRGRYFHGD